MEGWSVVGGRTYSYNTLSRIGPQITTVTLGVKDMERSRRFYLELGCAIERDLGECVSFKLGNLSSGITLVSWDTLAADTGMRPDEGGFSGITLNFNAHGAGQVDDLLEGVMRAGGTIVKTAQRAGWGGYFGYFADPDGHLWKVASA